MEREGGVVFPQLIYLNKAMRRQEDEDADKDENENEDEDGVAVQKFRRRRRTSHVDPIPLPYSRNTPPPYIHHPSSCSTMNIKAINGSWFTHVYTKSAAFAEGRRSLRERGGEELGGMRGYLLSCEWMIICALPNTLQPL